MIPPLEGCLNHERLCVCYLKNDTQNNYISLIVVSFVIQQLSQNNPTHIEASK